MGWGILGVAFWANAHTSLGALGFCSHHSLAAVGVSLTSPESDAPSEAASAPGPAHQVDYLIDNSWLHASSPRVLELAPPESDSDNVVRRLIMPARIEDLVFLSLIRNENLRVDLWPHRSAELHMHVRIFTNALSIYPAVSRRHFLARWLSSDRQWLLVLQAVVHLPRGVALLGCSPQWRWADFNETMPQALKEAVGRPFRVLEVECPLQPHGFLLPRRVTGSARQQAEGPRTPGDMLIRGCRFVFLVMLIIVCIAQVVLLLICITMLLVQVGIQRGRPAVV